MFIVEMIIFTAFLAAAVFSTSFISLVICLFGLGLALGCDYPTAHMIISENIPSTSRGRLVLGAFAFQAVGATGRQDHSGPGSQVPREFNADLAASAQDQNRTCARVVHGCDYDLR